MKTGKNNKSKAQYITVEDSATNTLESTHFSIGFDHKLAKKGTMYAMVNSLKEDDTAVQTDISSVSVGYFQRLASC